MNIRILNKTFFLSEIVLVSQLSLSYAASLIGLGTISGGMFFQSFAGSVSNDGSMVVGESVGATGVGEGFYWTSSTGMVDLGVPAASAVSNNYTVVGGGYNGDAYSWTQSGGFVDLGSLLGPGQGSYASGVSFDGSIIVGMSSSNNATPGHSEAFRWTQSGGMVGLGDLPGGSFYSVAHGVSADGSVVIGTGIIASNYGEAFRWTESGGMTGLGYLPGGTIVSEANGISADGSVIVGYSSGGSWEQAFRWTQATGMVGLGYLSNNKISEAFDVSADSDVIVGRAEDIGGDLHAIIWTPTDGMKDLLDLLVADGVDASHWQYLEVARTVSDDGNWIAGTGVNIDGNYEAFLAQIPEPETYALVFGGSALLFAIYRRHRLVKKGV